MTDDTKPSRFPWDKEPWIDHDKAQKRAIAAAQPRYVDPKSPAVQSWARAAFEDILSAVRGATEGERQKVLYPNATSMYEIVATGALDDTEAFEALRDACRTNNLEQDDGEPSVLRTLVNARRKGLDNPRDLSRVGTGRSDSSDAEPEQTPLVLSDFHALERGFWTQRDSLQTIYLGALARMCSPWAVLAHCAGRALSLVPPHITLPPIIGGPGSLNWFGAVAASSSQGKGGAHSVALELIPQPVLCKNLGTGEGFIDAFMRPADKETGEPAGRHQSVMFIASEIDTMTALKNRSGSTLLGVLRSGFSGETVGFSYRSNDAHLDAHSYRMTLMLSLQPEKASWLLADIHGGTPQRFQWFPGMDSRVTNEPPPMTAPLVLPNHSVWRYPREIKVPYETVELIRDERARAMCGDQDAMNGHSLYVREKFAYALAILDGRDEMTDDDWRLAGIAMRVSDHVRNYVAERVQLAAEAEARERGTQRGIEADAANVSRAAAEGKRNRRVDNWILGQLKTAGTRGLTEGDLRRTADSSVRRAIQPRLAVLQEQGEVTRTERRDGERTERWRLAR